MSKAFCNFCDDCEYCEFGWLDIFNVLHAQTDDGRWICDVCFDYKVCMDGPNRNPDGPCKEKDCKHRPKLIGPWEAKAASLDTFSEGIPAEYNFKE